MVSNARGQEWQPDSHADDGAAVAVYHREKAEQRRRRAEALEMVVAGYTHRQIAEHQGVKLKTITARLARAYKEQVPATLVDEARKMVLDRLQTRTLAVHQLMREARDNKDIDAYCKLNAQAIALDDRVIRVVGLEAPKRVLVEAEVTEVTEQDRELRDLINEAKMRNAGVRARMTQEPTE